ncbi:MAG TPA: acetyl/propionyl/methylcrotonyl-CoA carboxylase subunit alpha [Croceibacterium sp.]|nr:acetyl/propionyl/methylcrotonyl-CoA carboxylase subunit alpha [Croceibacterium sp.]
MIRSVLIANRGEIACRIIRTARAMGIRTVAVHSDADAGALHVRQADEAVHIGPSSAAESYLRGDRIIAAAKQTGAEAIHPGYGFLSENADFAQAVIDAGLIWIGPRPDSIRAMGLKDAAKSLMQQAGVPVTPGYMGEDQSAERLLAEAERIGFPVLIKAVAGGGGKGMRKVDAVADFLPALESCRREAQASFGNDGVLLEKWITSPRHIEVQIFGDTHGNVVHLFERDCSLQRRHQKVIEEAPAPGMDAATREAICGAAVRAAKAVDYVGAGTIEFIADAGDGLSADRVFFMEMNTRLQVEHPVTEEITGVDLVEWQLLVASGEELPLRQEDLSINGWAMEARLYAENSANGFLPSTGKLDHLRFSHCQRVETGVEEGDVISPFYDPMIAKLVSSGPDRESARQALARACGGVACAPVKSNAWFLKRLVERKEFAAGDVTTGFISDHIEELTTRTKPSDRSLSEALDWLLRASTDFDPRATGLAGFRLNAPKRAAQRLDVDGETVEFNFAPIPDDQLFEHSFAADDETGAQTLLMDGDAFRITWPRTAGSNSGNMSDGAIIAPMPGKVIAVDVAKGDTVTKGQRLLVLEAMKMEQALTAPFDGTVAELNTSAGAQVQVETLLARVEKAAD